MLFHRVLRPGLIAFPAIHLLASCSKGNLSANAVGLAILMARGLQLHVQSVNETFGPLERAVRSRAWAACLQMEATSSAMLYRQTTSTDIDFDPSGFPQPYDDDDLRENSVVAREHDKPKSITFFIETVKLFAIKCRILRSLYDLQQPKNFPHAHDVLVLEEQLLLWWKEVPDYLRDPTQAPVDGPWRMQAHVLLNRYINCRILVSDPSRARPPVSSRLTGRVGLRSCPAVPTVPVLRQSAHLSSASLPWAC